MDLSTLMWERNVVQCDEEGYRSGMCRVKGG